MNINISNSIKSKLFSGQLNNKAQIAEAQRINTIAQKTQAITPQNLNLGAVSQVISSQYLFELRKDIKRILKGRKLSSFLEHEFSEEEFDALPKSLQNLLLFNKKINSAEILEFIEDIDENHEINFRDYALNRTKFRAIFESLGKLLDVEMLAGNSTYVPLSDDFKVKRNVINIFAEFGDKIKETLGFNKKVNNNNDRHRSKE